MEPSKKKRRPRKQKTKREKEEAERKETATRMEINQKPSSSGSKQQKTKGPDLKDTTKEVEINQKPGLQQASKQKNTRGSDSKMSKKNNSDIKVSPEPPGRSGNNKEPNVQSNEGKVAETTVEEEEHYTDGSDIEVLPDPELEIINSSSLRENIEQNSFMNKDPLISLFEQLLQVENDPKKPSLTNQQDSRTEQQSEQSLQTRKEEEYDELEVLRAAITLTRISQNPTDVVQQESHIEQPTDLKLEPPKPHSELEVKAEIKSTTLLKNCSEDFEQDSLLQQQSDPILEPMKEDNDDLEVLRAAITLTRISQNPTDVVQQESKVEQTLKPLKEEEIELQNETEETKATSLSAFSSGEEDSVLKISELKLTEEKELVTEKIESISEVCETTDSWELITKSEESKKSEMKTTEEKESITEVCDTPESAELPTKNEESKISELKITEENELVTTQKELINEVCETPDSGDLATESEESKDSTGELYETLKSVEQVPESEKYSSSPESFVVIADEFKVDVMEDAKEKKEIQDLLLHFSRNTFQVKDCDPICQTALQKCIDIVSLDYKIFIIENTNGELCAHYPSQLIIMEAEKLSHRLSNNSSGSLKKKDVGTSFDSDFDISKLKDMFMKARSARCRARFPLPVILYNGKNICRSSTLSGGPEIYGRSGYNYFFYGDETGSPEQEEEEVHSKALTSQAGDWQLFDKVRRQDIRLLKTLNVGAIIDFMVEKKKVKFGVNVSSSEKVDKENRYNEFTIISLPYPGCEFFKEYRDNDYVADGLFFDWSQGHVDATIGIPNDTIASQLQIDWGNYKAWELVELTKNYMKLALEYLIEKSVGTLIHCISGWDRTPLFISLLRMSLWADGAIHQSLTPGQILYFTIAYDWMLFGHNLADRLSKGEDIFIFCFHFLKYIMGPEFSVNRLSTKNGFSMHADLETPYENVLFEKETPANSQDSNISLNSSWSSIINEVSPGFLQAEELSISNHSAVGNMGYSRNQHGDSLNSPTSTEYSENSLPSSPSFPSSHSSPSTCVNGNIDNGMGSPMSSSSDLRCLNSPQESKGSNSSFSSPVAVPNKTNVRTRNESTSSLSTGRRVERLTAVRNLFYNYYCTSVGFKLKDGSETRTLSDLFTNFIGKVGLSKKTNV